MIGALQFRQPRDRRTGFRCLRRSLTCSSLCNARLVFVPNEDQGYFLGGGSPRRPPKGASVARTDAMVERLGKTLRDMPEADHTIGVSDAASSPMRLRRSTAFQIPS